jgi:hypothetical protein
MPETLPTGLVLIVSAQLIADFPHKPQKFVLEKLTEGLREVYPELSTSPKFHFVLQQLQSYIQDSLTLFGELREGHDPRVHRILVAVLANLLSRVLSPSRSGAGKREEDEKHAR